MSRDPEPAWTLPRFLVATWNGPQVDDRGAQAAGLAAAGLNTVRWPLAELDLLRDHGLQAILDDTDPEQARTLIDDESVWGYHVVDEPEAAQYPELADRVRALRQADPRHPAYINLAARAGHDLTAYMEIVRPDFLSYDFYQWWYGPYQKWWEGTTGYFGRLEQHRDAALAAGVPLINWVEVVANRHDDRYRNAPKPTDSDAKVRQSLYTGLAYGLKGVQWFHGSLLFEDGTAQLNDCGRHIAALNAELQALGPLLLPLRSVGVYHTSPLPRGTREAPAQHWVLPEGDEFVMGELRGDDGSYLMVANRRTDNGGHARLVFQRRVCGVERFRRDTGTWEPVPLTTRPDRDDAWDPERIAAFLGVPARGREALDRLRRLNSYPPPHQVAEVFLAAGDGALLRVIE